MKPGLIQPNCVFAAGTALVILLLMFVLPVAGNSMQTETGTDRMGGSYQKIIIPGNNPDDCARACLEDSRCQAATYVMPGTFQGPEAWCWMKDSVPDVSPNDNCISFVKRPGTLLPPVDAGMVMITQDPAGRQKNPALSGNYLVWTGRPPDGMSAYNQIYLYDIAGQKTTRITDDEYDHGAVINGNRILWTDRTGIVLYNITSGQKTQVIRDSSGNARCPQISGDTVTWQDRRHLSMTIGGHANYGLYAIWEGSTEIYTYDLATGTETRITNDSYSQGCPVIEGNTIVWADDRNRALDIILYDLRTGTRKQIITGRSDFVEPKIYRNRVFWKDGQNISMYDIGAGALEQIPAGPFDHSGYTLSGDMILWGGGYRSPTGLEIYEIPYGKITPINGSTYVNYPAADQQHVAGVLVNPELQTDGGNIILYTLPDRFSSPTTPYVLTPVSGQQTGEKVPGFVGIFAIFGCFCIMVMRKLLQVNP